MSFERYKFTQLKTGPNREKTNSINIFIGLFLTLNFFVGTDQDPGLCQWNYHANLYEKAVKIAANWYSILYEIGRFWRKYYAKFYIA